MCKEFRTEPDTIISAQRMIVIFILTINSHFIAFVN